MENNLKKIELKHSEPLCKWKTPERKSQSFSATTSPSGRYFFVTYLFGINVLDTETGKEEFYLIHPDQAFLTESEFNICGFISVSDTVGYTIERTSEPYADFYLRRIEFNYEEIDFEVEERPINNLAFNVKWLTACFDYQHETQEMHIILRHEIPDAERVEGGPRDCKKWWSYKLDDQVWRKTRNTLPLNELDNLGSWDWFPKMYKDSLYIFPVKSTQNTVYAKLQQLNEIAKIDSQSGKMEMLRVKGGLEKWAANEEYEGSLFVDNMDFKWVGDSLFLLFIVVIRKDGCSYFQNRMAVLSLEKIEWREIQVGEYCKGEFSLNPYRMQVADNNQIYLLITSRGHPCTTFGFRADHTRRRLLWAPRVPVLKDESCIYSIPLGFRTPDVLENVVCKRVHELHPQLEDHPFYEYQQLLDKQYIGDKYIDDQPPCKKKILN